MKYLTGMLLLCLAYGGGTAAGGQESAIVLVHEGNAQAAIVLRAGANQIERSAAKDLQEYLTRISGAELPIIEGNTSPDRPAVLIGHSDLVNQLLSDVLDEEHLGYDGFVIRTYPNRLVLVGMDNNPDYRVEHEGNGTRFAVFAFLEKLGCRFYNASPVGEHVPQMSTIEVRELDIVSKPDFMRRRLDTSGYVRDHYTDRMKRAWKKWYLKNRFGGVPINTSHTYDSICPPHLFDEHPEYFTYSRAENKRLPPDRTDNQICLSNPEVVKRAIKEARRHLNKRTDVWGTSLSPADANMESWCECAPCLAMDHPDPKIGVATRVLAFNNKVAAEVQKTHPDRLLTYYADYLNMTGPPVLSDGTVVLEPHPMVVPVIVNRYCHQHDISDPDCPLNTDYRWRLNAWRRVADRLMSYEYYTHQFKLPRTPTPQTWLVGPRIKYYKSLDFISYKGEVLNRWPDNELACYIAGRMAWDADQNDRALVDEFFELYFQAAAEPMKAYYELLNTVGREPGVHGLFVSYESWTPEILARLNQALALGQKAATSDLVGRRIQREVEALKALTLVCRALSATRVWQDRPTSDSRRLAHEALKAAIAFVQEIAEQDLVASHRIQKSLESRLNQVSAAEQ